MKLLALVLEDAPQGLSQVKAYLRQNQFEVLEAATVAEAELRLQEFCPQLIFVDLDLIGAHLGWIEKIKAGPFGIVPIAVASRSTSVDTLSRCIQARVTDYILRPFHLKVLEKKLGALCLRLAQKSPYEIRPTPEQPLEAQLTSQCTITAISETGIQVGGSLMVGAPVEQLSFKTALFEAIGVKNPTLKLTNSGRRESATGEPEFVNFVQVQGWGESDRKLLRHWIRSQKLEVV